MGNKGETKFQRKKLDPRTKKRRKQKVIKNTPPQDGLRTEDENGVVDVYVETKLEKTKKPRMIRTYHFVSSIRNYLEGFEIFTQILGEIWTNLILYYKLYNARLYYS